MLQHKRKSYTCEIIVPYLQLKSRKILTTIADGLPDDLITLILDHLTVKELCSILLISKNHTSIINKYTRISNKIIRLDKLPTNSYLFANICYFQITYEGDLNNLPEKENSVHLIKFININYDITNEDLNNNADKLSNIHILDIIDCNNITDVCSLANIHTLYLNECMNLIDVSPLGNVYNLSLIGCEEITDVSALGNVYKLNLAGCLGVTDVSCLTNVYNLNLRGCIDVTDISNLYNVKYLNIYGCTGLASLE